MGGGFEPTLRMGRPPLPVQAATEPLLPHEMEHIRRVFDEDSAGKKHCSVASPREDAQMFRSTDRRAVTCECIAELYELLWRWGHSNTGSNRSFAAHFGFTIPETIVFEKGKPYAWYFISKKDGALLRKSAGSLTLSAMERKFCPPDRTEEEEAKTPICAVWFPKTSQFPEARCHSPYAEFLSVGATRSFLGGMRITHSGALQVFVQPHGVSNFLVRTVHFRDRTSLCCRTNRALLVRGRGPLFDRAATFEAWEGLSSSSSRYRSHRHPHMEELILNAGETLNKRIEQERVRQMLFLAPDQHVALHFKINSDNELFFIYASVVSEKEVILQTRPQLLMGDVCMTDELPGAALLPGGTTRKAIPHEFPSARDSTFALEDGFQDQVSALEASYTLRDGSMRESSLPPIWQPSMPPSEGRSVRRRPLSARRLESTILPRMACTRPEIPDVPYRFEKTPHLVQEAGRYEYVPPYLGGLDMIKRPLVGAATSRSEPPLTARNERASPGEGQPLAEGRAGPARQGSSEADPR